MRWALDQDLVNHDTGIPWYVRLWAAVLRRACVDWILYRDHDNIKLKKIGSDAGAWIFDDDDSNIGSFLSVCSIINLPPSLIRKKITSMSEEEARRLRGMEFGDEW